MDPKAGTPPDAEPRKRNLGLIIAVVAIVVLCCCGIAACAGLYFGYDYLGDPFGVYGSLPLIAI